MQGPDDKLQQLSEGAPVQVPHERNHCRHFWRGLGSQETDSATMTVSWMVQVRSCSPQSRHPCFPFPDQSEEKVLTTTTWRSEEETSDSLARGFMYQKMRFDVVPHSACHCSRELPTIDSKRDTCLGGGTKTGWQRSPPESRRREAAQRSAVGRKKNQETEVHA